MSLEGNPTVIDVRDGARGSIVYRDTVGKETTYYPAHYTWLVVEHLHLAIGLRESAEDSSASPLVTRIRGVARLEDLSLSVVGDPSSTTESLTISLEVGDWRADLDESEVVDSPMLLRETHLGGAMLGFNRADWEIGNDSEWWVSCYLPASFIEALAAALRSGQLASVSIGLGLRGLYTSNGVWASVSERGHLFIRPDRKDNTLAFPDVARGFIRSIQFTGPKVELRKLPAAQDNVALDDESPAPKARTDYNPVASAIESLAARVEALRSTLKWGGGVLLAILTLMLLR